MTINPTCHSPCTRSARRLPGRNADRGRDTRDPGPSCLRLAVLPVLLLAGLLLAAPTASAQDTVTVEVPARPGGLQVVVNACTRQCVATLSAAMVKVPRSAF